ncbi:hypothetical protein GF373_16720 [bacterium]|nr:hypothetical protein [bacterium]
MPTCDSIHVYGASDSIQLVDVQTVYFLTKERNPLPDWEDRIEYFMQRVRKFHAREFTGQSKLQYTLHPKPFVSTNTHAELPKDDINKFYWEIMNEVWHSGQIHFATNAHSILLVMADINFSAGYDDWTRLCSGENCPFPAPHAKCAGYVRSDGEDRPGSRAGGARSLFWKEKHIGLGLVTADGWRVPIKGSDCVVYHEGLGHAMGLPHPDPINNSVMGLAQYVDSLETTWIDDDQKESMGWKASKKNLTDLFSNFHVSHSPKNPSATDTVSITATCPARFSIETISCLYQDKLHLPFRPLKNTKTQVKNGQTVVQWQVPPIPKGSSLAYKVLLRTQTGKCEEIWHYYKIRR